MNELSYDTFVKWFRFVSTERFSGFIYIYKYIAGIKYEFVTGDGCTRHDSFYIVTNFTKIGSDIDAIRVGCHGWWALWITIYGARITFWKKRVVDCGVKSLVCVCVNCANWCSYCIDQWKCIYVAWIITWWTVVHWADACRSRCCDGWPIVLTAQLRQKPLFFQAGVCNDI